MITILFSVLLVVLYRITQLQQHGKLTWSKDKYGFWGKESDLRKWSVTIEDNIVDADLAPDNWYYRYIVQDIKKERWFTSSWLTVQFTDGYHMLQWCWLRCLNVIIADNMPGNFWLWFFGSWVGVSGLMWATERVFKNQ